MMLTKAFLQLSSWRLTKLNPISKETKKINLVEWNKFYNLKNEDLNVNILAIWVKIYISVLYMIKKLF